MTVKLLRARANEWALTAFARNAYDLTKEKLEKMDTDS